MVRLGAVLCSLCVAGGCSLRSYTPAPLDAHALPAAYAATSLEAIALRLDAGTPPHAPWTGDTLALLALANHRSLVAAHAEIAAAVAARATATRVNKPRVGAALEHHSDDRHGRRSHWSVGPQFAFTLQPPGRKRVRAALAELEVTHARIAAIARAWQVHGEAAQAALDVQEEMTRAALVDEELRARDALIAQAARYAEVGATDGLEWQTLTLDANRARLAGLKSITRLAAARARLAAAIEVPLVAVASVAFGASAEPAVPAAVDVRAHALQAHPEVLRALAAYDAAEHALELAVLAQFPDIELSPGYFFDQGDNVWSLLGGMVVPALGLHDADIAAAAAARDRAAREFEAAQARTIVAVEFAYANWQAAHALLDEAEQVAADIAREHAALIAHGGDALVIKRSNVQQAEVALELARARAAQVRRRVELEHAAAVSFGDPRLAQFLARIYRGED